MVKSRTQITIKDVDFKSLGDVIRRRVNKAAREALARSDSIIVESIDEAIEKNKRRLIPSLSDAGELGIGAGGSVDDTRRTGAWEGLKFGTGATTFKIFGLGKEKGGAVAEIVITINESVFYNLELSKIPTPDTDEFVPSEIPWMRWFTEGQTITGSRFSSRKRNRDISRTGRGIMIRGGIWTFPPKARDAFNKILDDARKIVNRRLRSEIGAIILRRLR